MSGIRKIKALLATVIVVLGLAATAGPLTAAGFTKDGSTSPDITSSRVGQPSVADRVLYADDSPELFGKEAAVRNALGFPAGKSRAGRHATDGIQKVEYDEVAEVDSSGQPLSLARFDGAGRLINAVRFDLAPGAAGKVTGDEASKTAAGALARTGLTLAGRARVEANPLSGGWDMHWDRSEGGFPVRGDETSAHVWPDGRIQSVARVEHQVSAPPGKRLLRADAQQAATRQLAKWFSSGESGYSIDTMDLQWVGPNAAFDPSKIDSPSVAYRLAWVVNVKPAGVAAEAIRLITIYVDAGNGTVIGGDVVE